MNYLAHLHLADATNTSLVGNLMGDFFKGVVGTANLPEELRIGIQLHRYIDSYTDNHPYVRSLRQQMSHHRRYGGIILDVLFDHELARNFGQYHDQTLNEFVSSSTRQFEIDDNFMSNQFVSVLTRMKQSNYLIEYQHIDVIEQVLDRIGQRFKKPVELGQSVNWYREQRALFDDFPSFYNELRVYSIAQAQRLIYPE